MTTVVPFRGDGVFEPGDIEAMSLALDDVCNTLNLSDDAKVEREVIALRIIALARRGERSCEVLRDRVLQDSGLAEGLDVVAARVCNDR
jgi:hypothetical protein